LGRGKGWTTGDRSGGPSGGKDGAWWKKNGNQFPSRLESGKGIPSQNAWLGTQHGVEPKFPKCKNTARGWGGPKVGGTVGGKQK